MQTKFKQQTSGGHGCFSQTAFSVDSLLINWMPS